MDNNTFIIWMLLVNFLIVWPIFLMLLFYRKINIKYIYKKLFLWFLFLIAIVSYCILIFLKNEKYFQKQIDNWDYRILLFSIPIFILLWFIWYYIIKLFIWKSNIKVFWNNFISWEILKWEFSLELRNDTINSNLNIYLRWYRFERKSWTKSGWSRKKRYEDILLLEENYSFKGNSTKNYDFTFNVPYLDSLDDVLGKAKEQFEQKWSSELEGKSWLNVLKWLYQYSWWNSREEDLKMWKIEVELERNGINLYDEKFIKIIRNIKKDK